MPQGCSACLSPMRDEIDRAILAGETLRDIAGRTGTSKSAIERHRAHVPATLALAARAAEETRADDLLGLLRECVADARRLRAKAESQDDVRGAIGAVKVLGEMVERLASVAERLAASDADSHREPRVIRLRWLDDPEEPLADLQPRTLAFPSDPRVLPS